MTPPKVPAPDPNPHRPLVDRILARCMRHLDQIIDARVTHSHSQQRRLDLSDAPTRRANRARDDQQTGAFLALTLRPDLPNTTPDDDLPSLLANLYDHEPPPDNDDTPPYGVDAILRKQTKDAPDQS